MNIILIYFAIKYNGNWDLIYKALDNKERVELKAISDLEEKLKTSDLKVITLLDLEYPKQLKEAYKPPFVLWCKGDINLLEQKPLTSVTGDLESLTTDNLVKLFVPEFSATKSIVLSNKNSLEAKIAEAIPKENGIVYITTQDVKTLKTKPNDLVLTEIPSATHRGFLDNDNVDSTIEVIHDSKNRLIAAFADEVILLSSTKKENSNSLNNFVTQFLSLGKEIYCFTGSGAENDGNPELIKQGAKLITNAKDISR